MIAAAGCAHAPSPAASGGNPWTQAGTLRIGSTEEPDALNELFAHSDATDQIVQLIDEPLFRYDQNGEFVPAAVTRVPSIANGDIREGGRAIVLHFRPGMQWSDGAPYDARDLAFTWRTVMNPSVNAKLRAGWDQIRTIDVSADHLTATVHLRQIYAGILGIFASAGGAAFPPLPEHALRGVADLNHAPVLNGAPISSGPFVLAHWNHGASLEFTPNPHYWRGAPGLTHISYRIVPNADTLLAQLRTHELDAVATLPETALSQLSSLHGYRISRQITANYRRLEFNLAKPQLSDPRVRLAIAEIVDWDRINRTVYHGYNVRAVSDVLPASWAAPHGFTPYPHDPAAAGRLLDAAGWRLGAGGKRMRGSVPLAFSVSTTTSKPANIQAEVQMQRDLAAAGVTLDILNYPTSFLFAQNGPIYSGRFDSEFSIDTNAPDPDDEGLWSSHFIPPHGANTGHLSDPVIDAASHAATLTYDRAARRALYQREQMRIHELVPVVYLYWQTEFSAVNSDMHLWKPASYISDFWNCWEWTI